MRNSPPTAQQKGADAMRKQHQTDHSLFLAFIIISHVASLSFALDNGLCLTPPMGWNSWNCFGWHGHDQDKCLAVADSMVCFGLLDAGYEYFCLDDGWQDSNNDTDTLRPNSRYSRGMKAFGDSLHARGFQFGIYTTCGMSRGRESAHCWKRHSQHVSADRGNPDQQGSHCH
ncbi:MAG: hypothetical protein GF418_13425 [Chitinivibrionales bacterium]|nr:hypothetical protein [Chitinivibrionales bacterium]MBD3396620.1 hypothetical protein [Chitinivibrionales bacterium]